MIKLIMSDMDGTLLDENGELPSEFDEVMAQLKARNILFAPASGRQYYCLLRQFQAYADDFVFLAENGTYALYQGKELFSCAMEREQVQEMLAIATTIPEARAVLCGKKSAYILPDEDERFLREIRLYYARCEVVDSFAGIEDDILKIAICDLSRGGSEFSSYPHFAAHSERFKVVVSSVLWMDVMNKAANKGVAVRQVQKLMGIAPEECMAFGDYMNDFEMMKSVYYSYAMENAHSEIKKIARFQAKSNREHGVMLAIRELLREL